MQDALVFILSTLFNLYLLTFAIRLLLQWARVDSRNQLVQFILRVTQPLVLPLRRVIPPIGRFDTATAVAMLCLQLAAIFVLVRIGCVLQPDLASLLALTVLSAVELLLQICFWAILIYVILSWVSPGSYNPATAMLHALVEPLLTPVRRLIPSIAGIDLSPLFAVIAIQAVMMLLPGRQILSGLLCTALVAAIF